LRPLLALFDVDGTLFLTDDTIAVEAFAEALRETYAVDAGDDLLARTDHAGQTSLRIARQVLTAAGVDDSLIEAHLPGWCARFADRYAVLLQDADTRDWKVAPGAASALARLTSAGVRVALLTGNPEPVARLRMARLGLERFFPVGQGAFGCDAEERTVLIALARERAGGWSARRTVEIGDTSRDVASAHDGGVRSIAVRTWEGEDVPGADAVCDDLEEVAEVLMAWNRLP
jgi:phosphoglycolate phosphatase